MYGAHMTTLAQRLKAAREAAGLTQPEIAAQCDPPVTPQAVYKWEKGTAQPSARNLDIIARLTKRSVKWFLYGVDNNLRNVNLAAAESVGRVVPSIEKQSISSFLSGDQGAAKKYIRTSFPASERAFQTVIDDDSNAPDLQIGDAVVVDPERAPKPGKLCLALQNGEPVIGRYRPRKDHVEIAPVNEDWPTLDVASEDIVGAITEITRPH